MKKILLSLALAGLAASCNATADMNSSADAAAPECSASAAECPMMSSECCDKAASCDAKSAEECAEKAAKCSSTKVCPVTGKTIEN